MAAAAGAVGNNEGVDGRNIECWEQVESAYGHGDLVGLCLIAEGAGHATACRLDWLGHKTGDAPEHLGCITRRREDLLVAMVVHHHPRSRLLSEWQCDVGLDKIALEQLRLCCDSIGLGTGQQRRPFIAQGIETTRLETENGNTTLRQRCQHCQRPLYLLARYRDIADGERCATAAKGSTRRGAHDSDAAAGGVEHDKCGARHLRLEPGVEGVCEEGNFWPLALRSWRLQEGACMPFWQIATSAEADTLT